MFASAQTLNQASSIVELTFDELEAVLGAASTAEKLSGTAVALAGASALAGGPSNPIGGALLAGAATTEVVALMFSAFG